MEIFSMRLKDFREKMKDKDKKWTQKYVADKIGVARVTYTAYENGTKTPPLDIIKRIAELFDLQSDYLLGRSDHPKLSAEKDNEVDQEVKELLKIIKSMPEDRRKEMEERILAYAKGLADANTRD